MNHLLRSLMMVVALNAGAAMAEKIVIIQKPLHLSTGFSFGSMILDGSKGEKNQTENVVCQRLGFDRGMIGSAKYGAQKAETVRLNSKGVAMEVVKGLPISRLQCVLGNNKMKRKQRLDSLVVLKDPTDSQGESYNLTSLEGAQSHQVCTDHGHLGAVSKSERFSNAAVEIRRGNLADTYASSEKIPVALSQIVCYANL